MISPARFLFSTVRMSVKSILALIVAISILINVATLTITGVHAMFTGALSAVGFSTVVAREVAEKVKQKTARRVTENTAREVAEKASREAAETAARKKATRKISREIAGSVTARTKRQALRNSASVFGESIPFLGVAVIAGALALEIKDSCDTAKDISAMAAAVETDGDPETARRKAEEAFDCKELIGEAIEVPSKEEIWRRMRESPQVAWDSASSAIDSLKGIDWSANWSNSIDSVLSFGEWVVSGFADEEG